MASKEDILQQTSLPKDEPCIHLRVEANEAILSRGVSSCKNRQFLWTVVTLAGLMLMGVSASVLFNPSEEHTDSEPGSAQTAPYVPALAFITTMPAVRPAFVRPPQSVRTPHAPRMHTQYRVPRVQMQNGGSSFSPTMPAVRPIRPFGFGPAPHVPRFHAPSRVPQLRMQSSVSSDQMEAFLKQPQPGFSWGEFNGRWNLDVQTFPPAQIQNIDMRQLLNTWLGVGIFDDTVGNDQASYQAFVFESTRRQSSGVATMCNFLADWYTVVKPSGTGTITRKYRIGHQPPEAVGLLKLAPAPSAVRIGDLFSLQNGASASDDAFVSALALFTREKLKDDSQGTLIKIVEAQFGIRATRDLFFRRKKRVPVFAIKGLAMAPENRVESAKVLLTKIATWANIEKKLVVVPKQMYSWPEAATPESTESALKRWAYYEQLGFQWVAMDVGVLAPDGEDGAYYELVYMGAASLPSHPSHKSYLSADSLLESTVFGTTYQEEVVDNQLMVQLNLE